MSTPFPGAGMQDEHSGPGSPIARTLEAEQLSLLCRQALRVPVVVIVICAYLVFLAWDHYRHDLLVVWALLTCGASILRMPVCARILQKPLARDELPFWIRLMLGFSILNGVLAGMGSLLFFSALPAEKQAILTMVLCCWSAGAIATTSAYPRSFYLFSIPFFAPLVYGWAVSDAHGAFVIALMIVLFALIQIAFLHDNGKMVVDSIRIRYENADLVIQLRAQQREAEAARERAEAANRAKSQFLAAASHDLRQPLYALSLFTAMLNEVAQDAATRDVAKNIEASVQSLDSLFAQLLDLSKLDAGVVKPVVSRFSVSNLLGQLGAEYGPRSAAKGLSFSMSICPDSVSSDPVLLERVVRNLLENAIRYTDRGEIRLSSRPSAYALAIEVADTGIGIPEAEQQRIFEEYYQLSNPSRDRKLGLGVGLAIVKRLAEMLNCEVQLQSRPGEGSVFRVIVPREHPAGLSHVPAPAEARKPAPGLQGLCVMVIEDDTSIQTGMRMLLDKWGCKALLADSLRAAKSLLQQADSHPGLIIADYRLPNGETGIEAIRALQAHLGKVPAILVTGDTAPERLQEATASGYPLLYKPVTAAELRDQIEQVLLPNPV